MKTTLTVLIMLVTLSVTSQKDRVDIYKVNTQFVSTINGTTSVNTYKPTDMYLALRYRLGNNSDLMEVQIIHSSLNKTEQYYAKSSPKETLNGMYLVVNSKDKNKFYFRLSTLAKDSYVQIKPIYGFSTQYNLDHYRTIYK